MTEHSAIERWWPLLVAESKHEIQSDLDAPLSEETVRRIVEIVGADASGAQEWVLTEKEKDFVRTQGEAVD